MEESKKYGECGHEAHNLNDELQCMICGCFSDEIISEDE